MASLDVEGLKRAIRQPTDERLWAIAEGLRRGWTVDEVNKLCRVDRWFLNKVKTLLERDSDPGKKVFKMVDTCAGEFESKTPYFYGAFESEDDALGRGGASTNPISTKIPE